MKDNASNSKLQIKAVVRNNKKYNLLGILIKLKQISLIHKEKSLIMFGNNSSNTVLEYDYSTNKFYYKSLNDKF